FRRYEVARKIRRDGEKEPVAELPVIGPFAVGAKIGERRFDLDDGDLAAAAERHDVGAATVGEGDLEQAGIAKLRQGAADAARQESGETGFLGRRRRDASLPGCGRFIKHVSLYPGPRVAALSPDGFPSLPWRDMN